MSRMITLEMKIQKIRNDILKNLDNHNSFDRKQSISNKRAILNSDPNEIVLIAGKGHENKQIYKNKIIKTSDKQIVKKLKLKLKNYQKQIGLICRIKNIKKLKHKKITKFPWISYELKSC